jgi:Zn-dependent M28 family amino/carboxypeptidase
MRRITLVAAFLLTAAAAQVTAQARTAAAPAGSRQARVAADVATLASDRWEGRRACTAGNDSAAHYIVDRLRAAGLRPGGEGGGYFQAWTIGTTSGTIQAAVAGCRVSNVVALLPGTGPLASQALVLGAHFDHLGTLRFGSLAADSGRIHNGADDNASGTAALLEIGRVLAAERRSAIIRNARTLVFVFFNAEEQGVLGSTYYAANPATPMDSTIAMLNFDMVGRMRENRVMVLGARTAVEWPALLDSVNARAGLDMRASGDGWGASDHASFTARRRPVLHFFTDLHEDYHRPSDDADRINAEGILRIADFAADVARRLMVRPSALTWVDVPRPQQSAGVSGRPRPSLGTIPDMSDEPGGVRLTGVRAGSPADSAGMREGDILVGLGEHEIANLQDFQNALMAHEAGQRTELRWRRGEVLMRFIVILGGRAN